MAESIRTEWNQNTEFCKELTTLRRRMHEARIERNYQGWYDIMNSIYMQLSPLMAKKKGTKDKEGNVVKKGLLEQNQDKKFRIRDEILPAIRARLVKGNRSVPVEWYNEFEEWEMMLRQVEYRFGLVVTEGDSPEFAALG